MTCRMCGKEIGPEEEFCSGLCESTFADMELEIHSAAAIMGRKGGKATGGKKAAASRENGKKGGRPKK